MVFDPPPSMPRRRPRSARAECAALDDRMMARPASEKPEQRSTERIQPPGRGDVDGHHLLEGFGLDMADRRE